MPTPSSSSGSSPKVPIPMLLNRESDRLPLPSLRVPPTPQPLHSLKHLHHPPTHPHLLPQPTYTLLSRPQYPFALYPQMAAYPPQPYMAHYPYMPVSGVPGVPVAPMEPVEYAYAHSGVSQAPVQKSRRFRRRYYQIYRKYSCLFPGCTKSYGLLNHLNTHIVTKKHGLRKSKADFKHVDRSDGEDAAHDMPPQDNTLRRPGYESGAEKALLGESAVLLAPSLAPVLLLPLVLPTPLWTPSGSLTLPLISASRETSVRLPLFPQIAAGATPGLMAPNPN